MNMTGRQDGIQEVEVFKKRNVSNMTHVIQILYRTNKPIITDQYPPSITTKLLIHHEAEPKAMSFDAETSKS